MFLCVKMLCKVQSTIKFKGMTLLILELSIMPIIMTKILSISISVTRPRPSKVGINGTIFPLRIRDSQWKTLFHSRNQLVYS